MVGFDRDRNALHRALERGIVDAEAATLAEAGTCFEAACVAVPLSAIAPCVAAASRQASVVFDVGSVKGPVIEALDAVSPNHANYANYVPCHPIAGSERNGPGAADAALFQDRAVVLTPTADTSAAAIDRVQRYWEAVGGRVETQSPESHDERFALLSHLPHLVAVAFMDVVGSPESFAGAGSGFRDFTRIAAGDAAVWHDILHGNATNVGRYLDELIAALQRLGEDAANGGPALRQRIESASRLRRAFEQADAGS